MYCFTNFEQKSIHNWLVKIYVNLLKYQLCIYFQCQINHSVFIVVIFLKENLLTVKL